jgi:hypothetical protein
MSERFGILGSPMRRIFSDIRVAVNVRALLRPLLVINLLNIGLLK